MNRGNVVFSAEHVYKAFGPTRANKDVSIELNRGEVRGLIGENGSGKSTLISMMSGVYRVDSGSMYMEGSRYDPYTPLDAGNHKIGTVVQELGLVDGLPIGTNVFLGRTERFKKNGFLNIKKLYREVESLFERWGFPSFGTHRMVGTLSIEEKKIVELIRALSIDPEVLILDEITQALSLNYRNMLFSIIKELREAGKAILVVTHDVEEMIEITDRITIMRDGEIVDTLDSRNASPDSVKRLMVGRDLQGSFYREDSCETYKNNVVLSVQDLTAEHFEDVTFDLHEGEILGICGLSDAGIHELAEALFAVRETVEGKVFHTRNGETVKNPWQAMRLGMGYVPKDRDKQALLINDSIENNVCLPAVEMVKSKAGCLIPQRRRALGKQVVEKYGVKATGIRQLLSGLSGGNRQKVNLGRWMVQGKDIMILDCPTRGVDVGVKSYIYHSMLSEKEKGVSMVLVSDELPELIGMADTLLVMQAGRVIRTIKRSAGFAEEAIIEEML